MKPIEEVILKVNNLIGVDVRTNIKDRHTPYKLGRQLVMFVAMERLGYTQQAAGDIFNKDHSTALHAHKVISGMMDVDKLFVIAFADVLYYVPKKKHVPGEMSFYPSGKMVLCNYCSGAGQIVGMTDVTFEPTVRSCPYCGGSGRLEEMTWYRRSPLIELDPEARQEIISKYIE